MIGEEKELENIEAEQEEVIPNEGTGNNGEESGSKLKAEAADEVEILRANLVKQEKLAQDYLNRLARLQADFENFKKRSRQEKQSILDLASEPFVISLLPVLDNFERAMQHSGGDVEDFKKGVSMIYNQLLDTLKAEGLEIILAEGEPFDPQKFEAVACGECKGVAEGTVLSELRKGYYFKRKVIRPAMVKVAKSQK